MSDVETTVARVLAEHQIRDIPAGPASCGSPVYGSPVCDWSWAQGQQVGAYAAHRAHVAAKVAEVLAGPAPACSCVCCLTGGCPDGTYAHPIPESATVTRWGVRMCDGEVESGFGTRAEAEGFMAMVRVHISAGEWLADDYEPMTVVTRQRTSYADVVTEWEVATNE